MEFIADGLLIATTLTAGIYCLVLSRRLARLTDSASGIGPQLEALDRALAETRERVDEMRAGIPQLTRENGRAAARMKDLEAAIGRAEKLLQRLYEAEERLAASEKRARADAPPEASTEDASAEEAGHSEKGGEAVIIAPGRKVVLPEGQVVAEAFEPRRPGDGPSGPTEAAARADGAAQTPGHGAGHGADDGAGDRGAVLRASRILL